MFVTRLKLKNWRNFKTVDVALRERQFIVGPNASGKSNFLDVFRFLRDIAKPAGGGLQQALATRGGLTKVRSLLARNDPEVHVEIELTETIEQDVPSWRYSLGIGQEQRGLHRTLLTHERVWRGSTLVLERPTAEDRNDHQRLTETYLEHTNDNAEFREISTFLQGITYLHIVPQLLKFSDKIQGRVIEEDPFGQGFLERIARTPSKTRDGRLRVIEKGLKLAVPQFRELKYKPDPSTGRPHLEVLYDHWRPFGARQSEDQFSDGTLRLIGLLWALLDGTSLLLLEEPETSLNAGIVAQLGPLFHRVQRTRRRQVLISTHSEDLLRDPGIDGREVLMIEPGREGSRAQIVSKVGVLRKLLKSGLSVGEIIIPRTRPKGADQLSFVF